MLSTLFDQDLWLEQYGKKMKEEGIKKGIEKGEEKERARIIANFKANGMSDAQISEFIFGDK